MSYLGVYFDGATAERRAVIVSLAEGGLALSQPDGGALAVWPLAAVERADDEGADGTTRLSYGAARLRVDGAPFAAALLAAAPALAPRSPGHRALRSLAITALAASVGLAGWWLVPRLDAPIAELVPQRWEARIGAEAITLMGGKACTGEAGNGALHRLVARLTAGVALPFPIVVEVTDRKEINAFAAPGGRIVVFQGLIASAQSPDEVAGVLAHEITHSRKHHPTRMLIRQIGTSFLEQLVIGTDTGGMAETLLVLSYSRQFETEADEGAVELLHNAGIDTASFANFFDRLEKAQHGGALPALLTTHPAPRKRSAMVRTDPTAETTPALDAGEWKALQSICPVSK
jgi:Zn-dependent protease with chaperone function